MDRLFGAHQQEKASQLVQPLHEHSDLVRHLSHFSISKANKKDRSLCFSDTQVKKACCTQP